jgi:hypothetical protein
MRTSTDDIVFESGSALQDLRRTLIELYAAVGADPQKPQDVSRQFGINRNLTWKLARVMKADGPFASLNHLPGPQGIELAVMALGKAGAPVESLEQVRAAMRRFLEVVDTHAGDRDQLELTLESMGLFEREYRMETGRELAFRGNCMIWGVQARTRLALAVVGPHSPNASTIVMLGGLLGFRRLRPNVRWRLMRMQVFNDSGVPSDLGLGEIAPRPKDQTPFVLPQFCTPSMPPVEQVDGPEGREFLLPPGPVGAQGAFDCISGYAVRGLPIHRDEGNAYASVASSITLPSESLLFDLVVHRDTHLGESGPEILVYGFPHGGMDSPAAQTQQNELPHNFKLAELVGSPPAIGTALVPGYSKMLAWIYEQMGWRPEEFRGYRVQVPYPVMSSRVVIRWPLLEPPGTQRVLNGA